MFVLNYSLESERLKVGFASYGTFESLFHHDCDIEFLPVMQSNLVYEFAKKSALLEQFNSVLYGLGYSVIDFYENVANFESIRRKCKSATASRKRKKNIQTVVA